MSAEIEEAPGHPEVVRIVAPNPGPMTLYGTNTYVVGSSPAWVVDPGPADAGHIERVRDVAESRGGIGGVVLTHSHSDHNEGVGMLGGSLAIGHAAGFDDLAAMMGAGPARLPEMPLKGERAQVGPFEAIATPGHAPDHVAYLHGDALLCGDLVLGEGSTIVPPASGGGSLVDYMESLERLAAVGADVLCPGHGPWITDPAAKLAEYAEHRRERERMLLAALEKGRRSVEDLLDAAWADVPAAMRPAAALAMRAHLEKLAAEDRLPGDLDGQGLL